MKKHCRKLVSFSLVVVMLFGLLTAVPLNTRAIESTTSGSVANRIEQLRQIYPDGSYFSVNGRACGCSGACSNCHLPTIMRSVYGNNNFTWSCYSCVGFARFAFWYVFGIAINNDAYTGVAPAGTTRISPSNMIIGDIAVWSGKHWAIYLGNGRYYHSNFGVTNRVYYNTAAYAYGPDWAFRANNYDRINANSFIPLDTPRFMQIKNSNTYKINVFTGQNAGDALSAGQQLRFVDKILVNNNWYLRTEFNHNDGGPYAIDFDRLVEIPYQPITPKLMTFTKDGWSSVPAAQISAGDSLPKDTTVKVVDQIVVNGKIYYRTQFNHDNNRNYGISSEFLNNFTPAPLDGPRDFIVNKSTTKIDILTGQTQPIALGTVLFISQKTIFNGTWYFQAYSDSGSYIFINSNDLSEIEPLTTTVTTDISQTTVNPTTTTAPAITTTKPTPAQTVIMRIDGLYAAVHGAKVKVNDAQDLTPIFNTGGRTMVPFRFIATCFGAEVDWDESSGSVIIDHKGKHIAIPINMPYAIVDGVQTEINAPAEIMTEYNRTFVPFRAVAQLLNIAVDYDFDTMTIVASEGEIDLQKCVRDYDDLMKS